MKRLESVLMIVILLSSAIAFRTPAGQVYAPGRETQSDLGDIEPLIDPAKIAWTQMNGPPGGNIRKLVQNPYRHNELYALSGNRLYRSRDKGENWQLVDKLRNMPVECVIPFKDGLFVCGDRVYYCDDQDNPKKILDEWFDQITISDNKLFVTGTRGRIEDFRILYTDLSSQNFDWKVITPSQAVLSDLVPPPKDIGFPSDVRPSNVIAIGNRILVNIVLLVQGSGQFSNGHLYSSEDLGKSWSKVDLDMPDGTVISNIIQDPQNPNHIILTLKHTIMHEAKSSLSKLIVQSFNGGRTWSPVTDLTFQSNGITDVDIVNSTHYIVCPFDGWMVKLSGSEDYEVMGMPTVKGFEGVTFFLDTLLFDYDDPNVVYGQTGSTWFYGLIKSEDNMKTWKKMDRGIVASSPSIVLCNPKDPNIIYTSGNVIQEKYFTTDGGTTWEPFSPTNAGDELKIDPHNPDHMLLVSEMTHIWESYDSGRTFKQINNDFWGAKVFDIAIAKDSPERIYVSNIGVGISELPLTEQDWRHLTGSPDYAYRIEVDPEDSDILYATYSPKIFENHSSIWRYTRDQSENFGWSEIFRINNSRGITSLTFDKSLPDRIYVGVIGKEGTIYVSYDKGKTWRKLNDQLTFTTIWGHSQLQIDPANKDIVYAGTWGGGTYKTTDGGKDWFLLDMNHTFSPTWLAISEKNPSIVYACDRTGAKIHRSNDSGRTWYTYYDFGKDYMLTSVVVIDPMDPDLIYASAFKPPMAHQGAFVKIKNGQKITDLSSGLPRSVIEMEIDPRNNDIFYVTTHMYGVFKSTDGGNTWQRLDDRGTGLPGTGIYDIDVDPTNSSILYATAIGGILPDYMLPPGVKNLEGKCGVYKSIDGGQNWRLILETMSEARGIDIDPNNDRNLYVADMMGGVWVSNDGGEHWRQENNGLGSISMTSVKIKENYIYASTQGSGVYAGLINKNGSITWDASRSNKPRAEVFKIQIEVDPNNPKRIYASAYPGGLLRSDDGGLHWNDKNFLTPSIRVEDPNLQGYYSFAINPSNPNIVWMGVYGKGMFISYDAMDSDMFANGEDNKMMGKKITKVVINPENPNQVYVSSEEGVFVTEDNGKHWRGMNDGLQTLDIRTLKLSTVEWTPFKDGFDDGTASQWNVESGWSVVKDGGNYVLQGIGHKWARTGSEEWGDYTFETKLKLIQGGVHINFRTSLEGRYFLGFREQGLYLSKQFNQWNRFADLTAIPDRYNLGQWYKFKVEVQGGDIKIYVDDVLKIGYTDPQPLLKGAIAFETFDDSRAYVDDISVQIRPRTALYAGTGGYGIYELDLNAADKRWINLGRTLGSGWWSAWDRRMYQFSSILFDPLVPGRVYLGHFPGGFFISEDNGHTWKDSSLGLGNDGIFSLTMDPRDPKIIWAGTYNGVAKSVDGGRTWRLKSNGMPSQQWPFSVAIDDENPNVMYASTKNGQNKGLAHRNDFWGVVMKSMDGGESWFKIMDGLNDRSEFYKIIIDPSYHNILFLSSSNSVFVSNDAGRTWKIIANGLSTTNNQARDNVADNLVLTPDGRYLLLGLREYGVWKANISNAIVLNRIPTASFSCSPNRPTVRDNVVFHDLSTDPDGSIVSRRWEFGDGSTSSEQNPIHKYKDKGNYTIKLMVSDNYGSNNTLTTILTVVNLPPIARFTFSPSDAFEDDEIKFTDESEDPEGHLASWKWDFGDGSMSSTQNPTHNYNRAGEFTISLTVTDDEGATGSVSRSLVTSPKYIYLYPPGLILVVILAWIIVKKRRR